jgi:hypothetical protein
MTQSMFQPSPGLTLRADDPDVLAEHRLVHRVFISMAIVIPILTAFTALLVFAAARIAGVPAVGPTAMGAGIGVLSGVFFGMWAGVVASVSDIEHVEYDKVETHGVDDDQL